MSQAIAVRQLANEFTPEQLEIIKKTVASGTDNEQFMLFIEVCKHTRLNPFARQIYAIVRNEKQKDGTYLKKMSIQTSIDGYRLLAQRSGEYAGQDGPYWYDEEKNEWVDVWLKDTPPAAAKVGVLRKGFQKYLYAVARFESYAVRGYNKQTNKMDGALTNLWAKMPELMIAKVAEALALRRAFPAELSGIYTDEEMLQADTPLPLPTITVEAEHTDMRPNGQQQEQMSDIGNAQKSHRIEAQRITVPLGNGSRLNALYTKVQGLGHIEKGLGKQEGATAFLKWAGEVLEVNIANVGQLTASRIETLEQFLNTKEAA